MDLSGGRTTMRRMIRWLAVVALAPGLGRATAQARMELGEPPPMNGSAQVLDADLARRLVGRYRSGDTIIDLNERNGRMFIIPRQGGFLKELRHTGDGLVVD